MFLCLSQAGSSSSSSSSQDNHSRGHRLDISVFHALNDRIKQQELRCRQTCYALKMQKQRTEQILLGSCQIPLSIRLQPTFPSLIRWTWFIHWGHIINYSNIFRPNGPGGRVVSAANLQTKRPEFDSSQSQNFFRRNQVSRTIHWLSFWIQLKCWIQLIFF